MKNSEMIRKLLQQNVLNVDYRKLNGQSRNIRCTLMPAHIDYTHEKKTIRGYQSSNNVSVWDLDNNEWRTLIVDHINNFEIEQNEDSTVEVETKPWGFDMSIDAFECDIETISNKQHIENFLKELVERIDMVAFGDPIIHSFGTGNKKGFTAIQMIETSNISCHFCEGTGAAYFNVFSCKKFDADEVVACIHDYFFPYSSRTRVLEREADPNHEYVDIGTTEY